MTCKSCGTQVSSRTKTCPSCGAPTQKTKTDIGAMITMCIFLFLSIVMVILTVAFG